ncbi:heat-inducible transcriptional repressor HrcA [Mycoplasma corogypsi]|uniref:heat-inducible transcriptional repressor HrcA n=1 Tax=Mycoplasma corogypsi TaxID=2106 RepID=UPI003873CA03
MNQIIENPKLNAKLEMILKYTVVLFIERGEPISSQQVYSRFENELDCKPATIRSLMNKLEQYGYLSKTNSATSGRIPTTLGLDYYAKYFSLSSDAQIKNKLEEIFRKKHYSIDETVAIAAQTISELTNFTLVTTTSASEFLLKGIEFVPISETKATIVIVLSSGEVFSNVIQVDTKVSTMEDVRIAVRIFKERLIDTPISQINQHLELLQNILSQSVHNYQVIIENFINNVFGQIYKNNYTNTVYGKNNIILSKDINRLHLNRILELIENHSIWEKIESELETDDKIRISVDESGSYMSKRISSENNNITEISVVGSKLANFDQMRTVLNVIEAYLTKEKRKK